MSIATLRPTFELHFPVQCSELDRRLRNQLATDEWRTTSLAFDRYAELHVPKSQIRYWSPHLSLHLIEEEDGTRVLARFAPRQEVWTLIWIIYLALTFTAFFAAIFAFSVWMIGQNSWLLIVPPLAILGIACIHVVSRIGQGWSSDQMLALRNDCSKLFDQVISAAS